MTYLLYYLAISVVFAFSMIALVRWFNEVEELSASQTLRLCLLWPVYLLLFVFSVIFFAVKLLRKKHDTNHRPDS